MASRRVDRSLLRVLRGLVAACRLLGVVAFAYWGARATLWANA